MAGQTLTYPLGTTVHLSGIFTKDATGTPCQGVNYTLTFVSGDSTGLGFATVGLGAPYLTCVKVGTYQIMVTATNGGGSLSTDAAGDVGIPDTINVVVPPPVTQGWTYV